MLPKSVPENPALCQNFAQSPVKLRIFSISDEPVRRTLGGDTGSQEQGCMTEIRDSVAGVGTESSIVSCVIRMHSELNELKITILRAVQ
jgi:hypothetical protein